MIDINKKLITKIYLNVFLSSMFVSIGWPGATMADSGNGLSVGTAQNSGIVPNVASIPGLASDFRQAFHADDLKISSLSGFFPNFALLNMNFGESRPMLKPLTCEVQAVVKRVLPANVESLKLAILAPSQVPSGLLLEQMGALKILFPAHLTGLQTEQIGTLLRLHRSILPVKNRQSLETKMQAMADALIKMSPVAEPLVSEFATPTESNHRVRRNGISAGDLPGRYQLKLEVPQQKEFTVELEISSDGDYSTRAGFKGGPNSNLELFGKWALQYGRFYGKNPTNGMGEQTTEIDLSGLALQDLQQGVQVVMKTKHLGASTAYLYRMTKIP